MRKEFPVNIESEEEWIDLPQGTHIHPKEVEKMFDDEEMGEEGREFGAYITPFGKVVKEDYGEHTHIDLAPEMSNKTRSRYIGTHSHPSAPFAEAHLLSHSLSRGDLRGPEKEMRVVSQNDLNISPSGEIHSFKPKRNRANKNVNYSGAYDLNIADKVYETKDKGIYKINSGFHYTRDIPDIKAEAEFNLAREYEGQTSVIKVRKSDDPKKVYITGIRSTYKDEPRYDLLDTLPRKKKKSNPLVIRIKPGFKFNGLIKFNPNGLSNMLVGVKKKSVKKCKCKK